MNHIYAQQTPKEIASILLKMERILNQYDSGVDSVYGTIQRQIAEQEASPANQAIWHSCMASFLSNYYQGNRYSILNRTPVEGTVPADLNVWDIQTLVKQIVFHYQQSLRDEEHLTAIPIRQYAPLLDSVSSEAYRPTLYDLLAFRALDFLSQRISEMPIPVTPFDVNNGKYWSDNSVFTNMTISSPDEYSFSYLTLKIMQTLTRLHLRDEDPRALLDVTLRRYEYLSSNSTLDNASETRLKELLKLEERGEFYQTRGKSYDKKTHPEYASDYVTAIEWYQTAAKDDPKSIEGKNALVRIARLKESSIDFAVVNIMPAGEPNLINFRYRNSQNIYFRIIPITDAEYSQLLRSDHFYRDLISKKRVYETSIPAPDEKDYRSKSGHFLMPALKQGLYVLLASNAPFSSNSKGDYSYCKVRISNLAANYRNNGPFYEFIFTDRVTGKPIDTNASTRFANTSSPATRTATAITCSPRKKSDG